MRVPPISCETDIPHAVGAKFDPRRLENAPLRVSRSERKLFVSQFGGQRWWKDKAEYVTIVSPSYQTVKSFEC